jgi:hypothetical protein
MQADKLDQVHDLGLRALQQQPSLATPQAVREHGEVEHQRRVRKNQVAEIDKNITLSPKREDQRPSPEALRAPILIPSA